jgi:hypothetical protein
LPEIRKRGGDRRVRWMKKIYDVMEEKGLKEGQ